MLVPYIILLRSYSFINPVKYEIQERDGLINDWIFNSLLNSPNSQSIAAAILIFLQALMITHLINRHKLNNVPASLVGLFYVVVVSSLKEFQQLSPQLIGLTFLIPVGYSVFSVYRRLNATNLIFNSSLLIAIASFIYMPYITAAIGVFIEIFVLRGFKLKERLAFLGGLVVLYWILGSFLFYFQSTQFASLYKFAIPGSLMGLLELPKIEIIKIVGFIFCSLIVFSSYYTYMKKKSIEGRKKISYFYWILIMVFVSVAFFPDLNSFHMLFAAISLSALISMNFLSMKNNSVAELLHILILTGVFTIHYGDLLRIT